MQICQKRFKDAGLFCMTIRPTLHFCLIHTVSRTPHGSSSFSITSLQAVELAARPVEGVSPGLLRATGVGVKESDKPRAVRIRGRKEPCFPPIACLM